MTPQPEGQRWGNSKSLFVGGIRMVTMWTGVHWWHLKNTSRISNPSTEFALGTHSILAHYAKGFQIPKGKNMMTLCPIVEMKRLHQKMIGQRWAIHWLDPSGHVGAELDEVKLFLCITEGKLVKLTKTMLVIQSSIYPDSETGDFTAIHRSLVVDYQKL